MRHSGNALKEFKCDTLVFDIPAFEVSQTVAISISLVSKSSANVAHFLDLGFAFPDVLKNSPLVGCYF